jgi:uncharacterized protein YjbJ (UPF0337 family)
MSGTDKLKNTAESLQGKAKEAVGNLTGDDEKKAEGRTDQKQADLKQAGENVKDVFK